MTRTSASIIIEDLTEQSESGESLKWTLSLSKRQTRGLRLHMSPADPITGQQIKTPPFSLNKGRDFLNAMRAAVFDITKTVVTKSDLHRWIERTAQIDERYANRVLFALRTEQEFAVQEAPDGLPICYSNRRLAIVDARAHPDLCYGRHYYIFDRLTGLEAGTAEWTRQGIYFGYVTYGPHELECGGYNLSELASSCLRDFEWTMRN